MKSFLQTQEWANFKCQFGWRQFKVEDNLVLSRSLISGKTMLYAPEVDFELWQSKAREFLEKIKEIAQKEKAIFFRAEFLNPDIKQNQKFLKEADFVKSFEEIQPENRIWIDLTKSEDEILAQMKSKGRYNIKVARRHGVKIEVSNNPQENQIDEFYQLYRETAKRAKFSYRGKNYFNELAKLPLIRLYLARYHENTLAAAMVVFYEGMASYLYGASSNEERQVMAPYLMHWQIIKDAKAAGCTTYDLLAVAPEGNEKHRYTNLTRFKEQFGGERVYLLGSWDLIFAPFWYKLYRYGEKIRRK